MTSTYLPLSSWRRPPAAASGYENGGFRFLKSRHFKAWQVVLHDSFFLLPSHGIQILYICEVRVLFAVAFSITAHEIKAAKTAI